ncbi:MAG: tRNA (guanosine(46)-N7)-methyltransferase TrmB [Erysipelothrix sp.]|nr:tRNA (guanosine(46)-N7)-methyltransferase TrmB [Erysipelothrix sp.]
MRMRNKPWAIPFLESFEDTVVKEPHLVASTWKARLNCEVLHVEIGSGKGDYWNIMAHLYPDHGWVAIEKDRNVAATSLKKNLIGILPTMALINLDAKDIGQWFASGEIDVLHLNFSDPWPKKGHSKRRLSHSDFLKEYKRLLSDNGEIQMKTDNSGLFEFSCVEMSNNGFICKELSVDYRRMPHPEDAITEYEQRFLDLNQPIYRAVWRKV